MSNINQSDLNLSLKEVKAFVEKVFTSINNNNENLHLTGYYNGGLRLCDEDIKLSESAVSSLHYAVKGKEDEKWSHKAIETLVWDAFYLAIDSQKKSNEEFTVRLDKAVFELRTKFTEPLKDWQFVFAISGLRIGDKLTEIGNVKLLQGNQKNIKSILKKSNSFINNTAHNKKEKEEFKALFAQQIETYFGNQVLAIAEAQAGDKEAGQKIALEATQTVLNIINFYSPKIYPKDLRIQVGLMGEVNRIPVLQIAFEEEAMNMQFFRYGPSWDFEFAEFTKISNKLGLPRLSNILKKTKHNEWEKRLFYAARIAGKAAVSRRREDSFLLYAIALESVLVGGNEQRDLTLLLSMRTSILLGKNLEERKKLKDKVAKLYGIRSAIAHRGENSFDDSDLDEISTLTTSIIILLLTKKEFKDFTKKQQLNDWIEQKMLSF